jgi:hypothetical protein
MKMFMELSPDQEQKFRNWARENYHPFTEISGIWHPVVQDECVKMNKENASYYPFLPKA